MPTNALLPLSAALLSSLLMLSPGAHPPGPPPPGAGFGPPPPHLVLEHMHERGVLTTDEATRVAARQLAQAQRPTLERLHERRRQAMDAYLSALAADERAEARARALADATAAELRLRRAELELTRRVHGLLRPTQRAQLLSLRPPAPPPPPRDALAQHARALGVDALTADAIADVFAHHEPALTSLHTRVRATRDAYLALAELDPRDPRLLASGARLDASVQQLRARELELLVELRSLTTDEQWSALAPMFAGPPPRGPHHGPHHDPPPHLQKNAGADD